ncbi:hypothetical protein [Salipiger marinus]|uniref:Uncharacterized protein n=1 Tax=Salipiger marinus TaxID=555512 RepID=A0A1G8UXA4_9RHOB|nr:hypothetical protein [Salipiger marinus]SDJ57550.1 hypothetical protein SAMN04487993_105212 [Salipiger marinus]
MTENTANDSGASTPSLGELQDELIRLAQSAPPGHRSRKALLHAAGQLSYAITGAIPRFYSSELLEFEERHKFRLIDRAVSTLKSVRDAISDMQRPPAPETVSMADLHCQISAMAVATPAIGTVRRWLLQAAAETAGWGEPDAAAQTTVAPAVINAATLRAFYDAHARQMIDAGALSACQSLSRAVAELEEMQAAAEAISA